jgi:glycosyltransferase involved in cell wall biosynthesis
MKICLISVEIFAWGKYGGFGRATRLIGRELVKRGHEVYAIVPRRGEQKEIEILDDITVFGFSPYRPWEAIRMIKKADADIYHSCEPSLATYFAVKHMPQRCHMVTFRDPRDLKDWIMEFERPSLNRLQVIHNYFYENNILVRRSIEKMNGVFTIGNYLVPKVKRMYKVSVEPRFLPTPVPVPLEIAKAKEPTVCYVARLDKRKRPELFLDLAIKYPHVQFIVLGKSRNKAWDSYLREKYGCLPNVVMHGFVDQFTSALHSETLEKSWVMVNTATREALPNSFIEAMSYKCAIMSSVDPDNIASKFGYFAKSDDFERGLAWLLKDREWEQRGQAAYEYTREVFELNRSIEQHITIYRSLIEQNKERR